MSAYRPYPKTKPSGVEWIGDVPEAWEITPFKHAATLRTQKSVGRRKAIGLENIESWSGRYIETESEFEGDGVAVEPGDILFGKLRPYLAKALIVTEPSDAVGDFHAMRPNRLTHTRFLLYQILSKEFIVMVDGSTFGSKMPRASWEFVGKMPLPLPPLPEQHQIAAFLGRECGKLDALQDKQERLIELLKEKRQALISHAVTRGLDPTAKLKPSGIEWLGEVPEHWEISQPRFVCRHSGGGTPSKDNPLFWNGDIPWVSPKDMKRDIIEDSIDHITMEAVSQSATNLIPVGAILMVVRGMILLHSVPVAITAAPVTVNQDMKALICGKRLNSRFFLLLLKGLRDAVLDLVDASGHGTRCMKFEDFLRMGIPLPPLAEQRAIVAHLDEKCGKIDQLKAKAERGIELLKERRSALISAAVTGKIDVRDA